MAQSLKVFNMEELQAASDKIKTNRVLGPEGISPESINLMVYGDIEVRGGPKKSQCRFRKGNSTVDALMEVNEIAKKARHLRKWCALISVDVKNTFNSAL